MRSKTKSRRHSGSMLIESGLSQNIHLNDGGNSTDGTLTLESETGDLTSYTFAAPTTTLSLRAGDQGDTFVLDFCRYGFCGQCVPHRW